MKTKIDHLQMRPYRGEVDFWRIRAFLREVMMVNKFRELSWHVARLDYWRWHLLLNCRDVDSLIGFVFIWETTDGQIAAVLNPEGTGEGHLQVHPGYRSKLLETAMIAHAEKSLSAEQDGYRELVVWSNSEDAQRQEILVSRGYTQGKWIETQWRRDLDAPISDISIPDGYNIRSLGNVDELPARSWASWRGFHPEAPDEDYEGWKWYLNIQRCPLYRRDLDVVAIAPDGDIASFCTIWYDDVTRTAYIEPVATVPEHRRHGLARAAITAGLQRLQQMGAVRAFVSGYEPGPNALYSSTLSPDHDKSEQWIKKW